MSEYEQELLKQESHGAAAILSRSACGTFCRFFRLVHGGVGYGFGRASAECGRKASWYAFQREALERGAVGARGARGGAGMAESGIKHVSGEGLRETNTRSRNFAMPGRLATATGFAAAFVLWCAVALATTAVSAAASEFKVLIVMSYDEQYAWEQEIREGLDEVLQGTCETRYVYLDTKRDLAGGEEKSKAAYRVFEEFGPDGVIAADDNAQSMFVVPYLKDKVDAPVVFCGVNAEAKAYGYPSKNVTGIVERLHIGKTIAFAQQLIPSIKTIALVLKDSPSGKAVYEQYRNEQNQYPARTIGFITPNTLEEALEAVENLKDKTDAIFYETMEGIRDKTGRIYTDREVLPLLREKYGKPIVANNLYHVEYGAFCAVIKTGQEQGRKAAEMLLSAMRGTPVSQIPVVGNREGKRVINLNVMKSLGVLPASTALSGTKLVGIEQQ